MFGGIFLGAGIGLAVRGGAVLDRAEVAARILTDLGRGVTIYKGRGGLSDEDQEILYCVVTRLEIRKVKAIVRAVDARAFVTSHALADVDGGVVSRAALH